MTKREYIETYDDRELARFLATVAGYGGNKEEVDFWEDWLKTERPKAEPCEDCVSRQAPSVTPKEKTAVWVGIDQEPHEVYECNACGWLLYDEDRTDFKYCPNCGARMESEG